MAQPDEARRVARVDFFIKTKEPHRLKTSTDPLIHYSYVRDVLAEPGFEPSSIDCREGASFSGQSRHTPEVWFPENDSGSTRRENLRLQLGHDRPDFKYPGLIVNHAAVTRYLKKDGHGVLSRGEIVKAYAQELIDGVLSIPPRLAPNAYEADREKLDALVPKGKVLKLTLEKSK